MKIVRVSKSMFYSLKQNGTLTVRSSFIILRGRVAVDRMIVERYPNYYYHDGINPGRRLNTLDYARRNGMIEILEVKGRDKYDSLHPQDKQF